MLRPPRGGRGGGGRRRQRSWTEESPLFLLLARGANTALFPFPPPPVFASAASLPPSSSTDALVARQACPLFCCPYEMSRTCVRRCEGEREGGRGRPEEETGFVIGMKSRGTSLLFSLCVNTYNSKGVDVGNGRKDKLAPPTFPLLPGTNYRM